MNKKYKLKKDSCWESVKATYEGYNTSDILFEDDFEEVEELPKIELKPITRDNFKIHEPLGTCYRVDIRKGMPATVFIKKEEIKEFNEKCSQLFGFELIEPIGE
jgi:hypothetical protein